MEKPPAFISYKYKILFKATVQNVNGLLFMFMTETSFPFISLGMTSIPNDMALARREVSAGLYSPLAFYVSKNLANWPFNLLQVVLMVAFMFSSSTLGKEVKVMVHHPQHN